MQTDSSSRVRQLDSTVQSKIRHLDEQISDLIEAKKEDNDFFSRGASSLPAQTVHLNQGLQSAVSLLKVREFIYLNLGQSPKNIAFYDSKKASELQAEKIQSKTDALILQFLRARPKRRGNWSLNSWVSASLGVCGRVCCGGGSGPEGYKT